MKFFQCKSKKDDVKNNFNTIDILIKPFFKTIYQVFVVVKKFIQPAFLPITL